MSEDQLAAARDGFERHRWREAFEHFNAADREAGPLAPEDLDLLAQAAWWISRSDDCLDARQRSYAGYLARGEQARAGYEAVWLARDNFVRRRERIGLGWMRRAERLLEPLPESVEHAYLELLRAAVASASGDHDAAEDHAARAAELGARFGDRDVEARALTSQGEARVMLGRVEEGMALMDEATFAAVGGELGPLATGIVYCNVIDVCAQLTDYRRAGEWTEAAQRWCERQSVSGFPGVCRVHRAEIMRLRGAWSEAEREARVAAEELAQHGVLSYAAAALLEVGEIRLRMGDLSGAEEAFRQAYEGGRNPQPGLALVRLAAGDASTAWAQLRRALEDTTPPLSRARLLPAAVRIALAVGDRTAAASAADELFEIAERYGTDVLRASAAGARGAVRLAEGELAEAIRLTRSGIDAWRELEAPYEEAEAREQLGLAYRAAGDEEAAGLELRAALRGFERLGAGRDVQRVSDALGLRRAPPREVTRTFMFTDIVGSTALIEAVGDAAWNDVREWHDRVLRASFVAHGGEEVDHSGDGFFVAFADAGQALACAVGIQRLLREHRRTHGFAPRVRIGLHADRASRADDTYAGRGVHVASRVGALAGADEIVATAATLAASDGEWRVAETRDVQLKGISDTVQIMSVDWREARTETADEETVDDDQTP